MLMAEFPFDSQQMDGHSAEDEDQMTYNVWAKQVCRGGWMLPLSLLPSKKHTSWQHKAALR